MRNEDNWENSTNRNMRFIWWMIKILCLVNPPPIKKSKIQEIPINSFWLMSKIIFLIDHFLIREYNLFIQNTESSLSNKNRILHLWKSQEFNSYNTAREFSKWPSNIFEIFLVHYTIQWLNCVVRYLNVRIDWKLV